MSEERDIHTDYNGCHHHSVKHASYLSVHFSTLRPRRLSAHFARHAKECASRAGIGKPLDLAAGRENDARARGYAEGALTANTYKDGLLGSVYRAKYTTTGTYAGNTNVRID